VIFSNDVLRMLKLKERLLKRPWPIDILCIWKNYELLRFRVEV